MAEVGESSALLPTPIPNKAVFVRVKRKPDQSPVEALWLEINERPLKRPLIDFHKLSISSSSPPVAEESKTRRVLVQHVETLRDSKATHDFLNTFVKPNANGHTEFKPTIKDRRCSLQKEKKLDHLLSKAKQEQKELAKTARFEQIWKRRKEKMQPSNDLDEVCRVYDIVQVDEEETATTVKQHEEISIEDQEILSKFLPLLRECIPSAAVEIESDISAHAERQDSVDEYVYDIYAVKENVDEPVAAYPFPLVQVDDDDDFFDGPDDSDYETDDSNAENHPQNDYPEEESTDEEKRSEQSGSQSEEDGSETESDTWTKSDYSESFERSLDPLYDDEMDDYLDDDKNHADCDDEADDESWRWAYR